MISKVNFIIVTFMLIIVGSTVYSQEVELIYYDLEIPCKVLTRQKDFIINNKLDAPWLLDCKLSDFKFYKYTILGFVRQGSCGRNDSMDLQITEDQTNRKHIIITKYNIGCRCMVLGPPLVKIVYTEKFRRGYTIEYQE